MAQVGWGNAANAPPVDPNAPYTLTKLSIIRRMDDDEVLIMDGVFTQADAVLRQSWAAATEIRSDDNLFPVLRDTFAAFLPGGLERATAILAR